MSYTVFIDGEAGTTGLQIRDMLAARSDIRLIRLDDARRKDLDARLEALREADVSILCLPDNAAREIAEHLSPAEARLIDASTAHRVHPDWAFGFPELSPDYRARLAGATRVSNPGCYSTGAIALLAPLTASGQIAPDAPVSIHAISGYSGGGKSMINEFETGQTDGAFIYALGQTHKHLPEIMRYGGLAKRPIFSPSVGAFAQGMIVQIPLPFVPAGQKEALEATLHAAYDQSVFVSVLTPDVYGARLDPRRVNGTNRLELSVQGDDSTGCLILVAVLDNLGKGASGAAVQNLNILLGLDETTGLAA
ncbi:MAG: N-acetyl-gamma-glutamyl-phosphate reductase [Pseudomonadota bacterium]